MKKIKKVLILGANSDIGLETIKFFLDNNWHITAHYNQYNSNTKKIEKLNSKKQEISLFKFDFVNINEFEKFIIKNQSFFKNFDSFVSLTGFQKLKNFNDFKICDFTNHINVNYFSNILIIRELLKHMRKKKWGRIVLASSIGTKFGGSDNSFMYSLSKYMNEFFPSLYKNFFKYNILINTLKIGVTNTRVVRLNKKDNLKKRISLIPLKRMAKPSEVAKYIYFLSSEENTLITNEIINISGGE
tara:strand:- start:667 stop:1398 length:732 start_codon:yes stop_codon:yes gene_type:complete